MSLLLAAHLALAADPHALDGSVAPLDPGTLVVVWQLDDPASLVALREAVVEARRRDLDVVALNTDAAADTARVGGWLHANGLVVPAVLDPDHRWTGALGLRAGELGVIGQAGVVAKLGLPASVPPALATR